MNDLGLIAIGIFVSSFFISCLVCQFIVVGSGEKRDDDNHNFLIICMICLPLLILIFGELFGLWE